MKVIILYQIIILVESEVPKIGRPVIIDLQENEEEMLLSDLRITNLGTPMDFDGHRIL